MKNLSIQNSNDNSDQENLLYQYCSSEWHPYIDLNQIKIKIKKSGILFTEEEEMQGIYLLDKGVVKIVSGSDTKSERIFRFTSKGNIIGHRAISSDRYPISAVALTDTELTFIPKNTFIKLLKMNAELSMFLINYFVEEVRKIDARIKYRTQLDIKQYIGYIILLLIDTFGYDDVIPNKLSFTPSRRDFARFAGNTYETIIRVLLYLQKEKYFKLKEKEIYITNEIGLRKFVEIKL